MAITISVSDANKDGKGVDFSAYLKNFDATYASSGYGGWSNPDESDSFKGEGYVTSNSSSDGGTSVIFMSTSNFAYDLSTHVVSGTLKSITFGTDTVYDSASQTYSNSGDITISGFSKYSTSTADGQVMGDLMDSRVSTLTSLLSSNAIIFKGSTGSDTFTGYGYADTISGGNGNDTLSGAGGADVISGGAGKDVLNGGAGSDTLSGGDGNDTISGGSSADKISGNAGNDVLKGGSGNDALTGGDGNDTLSGETGNDTISGGAGVDTLTGGDGNDVLKGGSGNDKLSGGSGNDNLTGNSGADALSGGAGADTFHFVKGDGKDIITDFAAGKSGTDVIEFAHGLFDDYADIIASSKNTSDGVLITYSGGSVLLDDVKIADLHKSDFHLL